MSMHRQLMTGLGVCALVFLTSVVLAFMVPEVLNESAFSDMRPLKIGDILSEAEVQQRTNQTEMANRELERQLKDTSVSSQFLHRTGTFILWTGVLTGICIGGLACWRKRLREIVWLALPLSILVLLAVAVKVVA